MIFLNHWLDQCCGVGAGGAEIIRDLEPEPNPKLSAVSMEDATMKKTLPCDISYSTAVFYSFRLQYMAGAGAEIRDKVGAGNKKNSAP